MAMTKKERAEFDAALKEARILGALRWTGEVLPDVAPPSNGSKFGTLSKGFAFAGWDHVRIEPAYSSSISHNIGRDDGTSMQQPRWLYSTRLLALQAARNSLERRFAESLAVIDAAIADEKSKANAA